MKFPAAALLALTILMPGVAAACPGLRVSDGWIRQSSDGAMMTAAYATLSNSGKRALVIDGAVAAGFDSAELHRSVIENGMHRMREGQLRIEPGASARLEPGGWHLMLFQPPVLASGEKVAVSLQCGTTAVSSQFEIRAP